MGKMVGLHPTSLVCKNYRSLFTAVIVTGVSLGGYGAETVRVLALVGARVVLAGRTYSKYVHIYSASWSSL